MRLLLVVVLAIVGIFALLQPAKPTSTPAPVLPPLKALAEEKESVARSIEGAFQLIMRSEKQTDGANTYSFVVVNTTSGERRTLFTKTVAAQASMLLPRNSWSPDNKYVFVQENEPDSLHYLVLTVSGEPFADGNQTLDLFPIFTKSQPSLRLKDVTGWDAVNLLHVTTSKEDGSKGPAFWFDVTSRAFLELY